MLAAGAPYAAFDQQFRNMQGPMRLVSPAAPVMNASGRSKIRGVLPENNREFVLFLQGITRGWVRIGAGGRRR